MFNDELKTQVEEVINKNLPALAAKEVVERLQKIEALEKANADLLLQKETNKKHMDEINAKLSKYSDIETRENALIANEAKLKTEQKDFEYEKKLINLKLEHANQSKNEIYNLSSIFFSSPIKTTVINKSYNENDYNNGMTNKNTSGSENTTITEK